jgi:ketosteroid isomerase-like protein
MSEENVELVRNTLTFFNRRDEDAWIAGCDPEVENIPPREWPESAPIRGARAIWEFFVQAQATWEDGSFEWGELIDASSEKVVANQRRNMRGRTSGAAVDWNYWIVFTLRNEKALRLEWFAERADAMQAAHLSE